MKTTRTKGSTSVTDNIVNIVQWLESIPA